MIKLKRAYEKPSRDDGSRILVERLWPLGLTRERAAVDLWLKEVAPRALPRVLDRARCPPATPSQVETVAALGISTPGGPKGGDMVPNDFIGAR
jgi:hypothetical protein